MRRVRELYRASVGLALALGARALGAAASSADAGPRREIGACRDAGPVANFSLKEYVDREWYVAAQKPTPYQPTSDFFCVRANYTIIDERTISIWNTASRNGVDGAPINGLAWFRLRGIIEEVPSKISVGMAFLPTFTYGPYWVVATDVATDSEEFRERGYSWAIVSAGPPAIPRANGLCEPVGGLWLFVRDPDASDEIVSQMKDTVRSLGMDPDVLVPVLQAGCSYPQL